MGKEGSVSRLPHLFDPVAILTSTKLWDQF